MLGLKLLLRQCLGCLNGSYTFLDKSLYFHCSTYMYIFHCYSPFNTLQYRGIRRHDFSRGVQFAEIF